jgi:carbon-monoxide dehydrogenase medium subunit
MRFELLQPRSLREALQMKQDAGERARLLAGGTDLLVLLKERKVKTEAVISLGRVRELNFIQANQEGITLGALATHSAVAGSEIVKEKFPDVAEACAQIGAAQIQNLGTVGGNLCNASPAADTAAPLLVSDAMLTLASARGTRRVSIHDFFLGPRLTVLQADEILTDIFLPYTAGRRGATYLKLGRRHAMEIAIVGLGVAVYLNGSDRVVSECRIAMGSVAPTVIRARAAEEILRAREISDDLVDEIAAVAADAARPISDVRASAEYRLDMIRVLCRRATAAALARARQSTPEGLS